MRLAKDRLKSVMPTAQQILGLVKSHSLGDEERFHALTMQLAASEERRGHKKLAEELRELAEKALAERKTRDDTASVASRLVPLARPRGELSGIMSATYPKTRINDLILPEPTADLLKRIVEEQRQRWRLREHGLLPRQKLLLVGPPGSGKTMTASALAGELGFPLFSVLLHGLITKFMGETAAKLRLVFDSIANQRGVYLFDEVDALAGQRTSQHDVGEARRILNSFLQFLDEDASESLIVGTTNHPEILDRAIFRRFHVVVAYELPEKNLVIQTLRSRLIAFDTSAVDWESVASAGHGLSNADLIRAAEDAARQAILDHGPKLATADLVRALLERRTGLMGAKYGHSNKAPSSPPKRSRKGAQVPDQKDRASKKA